MHDNSSKDVLVIAGPTASGKSNLALSVAHTRSSVIINADSLQLFDDLKILTAHPSRSSQAVVPHVLYGVIQDIHFTPNVAWWLERAHQEIAKAIAKDKLPIVVGGTGFYLKALLEGLDDLPNIAPQTRNFVRDLYDQKGLEGLQETYLMRLKPLESGKIPQDPQRLMRALEVLLETGHDLSVFHGKRKNVPPWSFHCVLIDDDRDRLEARAKKRIHQMFEAGVEEEVAAFLKKMPAHDCTLRKALGLREIEAHLREKRNIREVIKAITTATRQYIKRQQTWFRHQYTIDHKLTSSDPNSAEKLLRFLHCNS